MGGGIPTWERLWRSLRDPLTWTLGACLAVYEVVVRHGQDQAVMVLIGGLLGLPIVVRFEERRRQEDDK